MILTFEKTKSLGDVRINEASTLRDLIRVIRPLNCAIKFSENGEWQWYRKDCWLMTESKTILEQFKKFSPLELDIAHADIITINDFERELFIELGNSPIFELKFNKPLGLCYLEVFGKDNAISLGAISHFKKVYLKNLNPNEDTDSDWELVYDEAKDIVENIASMPYGRTDLAHLRKMNVDNTNHTLYIEFED